MIRRKDKDAAFERVRRRVYALVRRAADDGGLPFDDALSAAFLGVAQAFRGYAKAKGSLGTWAWKKAVSRILDEQRAEAKVRQRETPVEFTELDMYQVTAVPWKFELHAVEDLDARFVADCVLRPLGRVATLMGRPGTRPERVRNALKLQLRRRGWGRTRIAKAFKELTRSLAETE